MSEDQKNPRELDEKQNAEAKNQQHSQDKTGGAGSNSRVEKKTPQNEEEGDIKNETEKPERKISPPEKTVKEPTAQPGTDKTGSEIRP